MLPCLPLSLLSLQDPALLSLAKMWAVMWQLCHMTQGRQCISCQTDDMARSAQNPVRLGTTMKASTTERRLSDVLVAWVTISVANYISSEKRMTCAVVFIWSSSKVQSGFIFLFTALVGSEIWSLVQNAYIVAQIQFLYEHSKNILSRLKRFQLVADLYTTVKS